MKPRLVAALVLFLACLATTGPAGAQDYPTKPITIIVPYTPGDGPDVAARLIGAKMSESLGQSVIQTRIIGIAAIVVAAAACSPPEANASGNASSRLMSTSADCSKASSEKPTARATC